MKKITLFLLFISLHVSANDSLIQLLEGHDVPTETYEITGDAASFTGEELRHRVGQMIKRDMLLQYTVTDHDSATGQCLQKEIVKLFTSDGETFDPSRFAHCGGIFDPPGSMNESTDIRSLDAHELKHHKQVILAKRVATAECNRDLSAYVLKLPVFTAPQHLVDIVYHLRPPSRGYHLTDGLSFHCITPRTQAGN